ncbi:MAG: hypothetical protein P8I83_05190 [Paracoccaceae bacterium]|nr:hypothetical protein [Paracoccaceae bacterium]
MQKVTIHGPAPALYSRTARLAFDAKELPHALVSKSKLTVAAAPNEHTAS